MSKYHQQSAAFMLRIILLAGTGDLVAQSGGETTPATGETASAERAAVGELTEEAARELATDLREAITENIDTSMMDSAQASPESQQAASSGAQERIEPGEEEAPWYYRFRPITNNLQTLPDHVPGLAGKGWLQFGRIEGEYAHFSSGRLGDDSGFNFRSLRVGIIRKFNERTTVKLEVDLTDGDSNWVDLYWRFNTRLGLFTVGNQKIAQTLVIQTSRLARTFMEEPLPSEAFSLGRRLGVGWDFHRSRVGVHITAFGKDLNDNIGDFGYGARFYFNPVKTRFNMFHLGLSAVREKMDFDAQFRTRPETRVTDIRLVDTGTDAGVNTQSVYGLELAAARNNWSVRGEYFIAEWDRDFAANPEFDGYYVQANWAITGETFQYMQGKFLRLRPRRSGGAWEIAARYSRVNLNDLDVLGGEEKNISIGLNWYGPGNQFRIMSNLIFVDTDAVAGNESPTILQIRAQMHW